MKNLVLIDSGNTNISIAKARNNRGWEIIKRKQDEDASFIDDLNENDFAILSTVNNSEKIKEKLKNKKIDFISIADFKADKKFKNWTHKYAKTIGDDRIVQIYYLAQHLMNERLMLIDAGTFITCDFILLGDYKGGTINPGIELYLESYKKGNDLPYINIDNFRKYILGPKDPFPQTTQAAIFHSAYEYLKGLLLKAKKMGLDSIYITGGNANDILALIKYLDIDLNIITKPDLIFDALEFFFNDLENKDGILQ